LPWIARLVAMATTVALSGCLVAAASNDPAVVVVAIAVVNACSAFVFAVMLAAIGCWVASRRGIRTAVASISRPLAGSVISYVAIVSADAQRALALAWAAPIIAAWIALHVRWSLRAIHAAVSEAQSHVP
jgi:hypothetical protein